MLAVFDGHGDDGHIIAEYMRDHLPSLVFNHAAFNTFIRKPDNIEPPPKSPEEAEAMLERARSMKDRVSSFPVLASYAKGEREADLRRDVETALKDSLKKCEMQLLSNRDVDCNLSGCTACVAVICGNHLTIANIGDSRATLLRVPPKGTPGGRPLFPSVLTIDHKPSLPGETKRILLAGGRVKAVSYEDGQDGPVRVWCNDQDLPGLSMSRSVCDVLGKRAGVSSAPDFYSYTLNAEDAYIVIASDGLWEFINAVDVADVVAATALEAHDELIAYEANGGDKSGKDPPLEHIQLALDRLADAATRRFLSQEGYADDVSIIIAEIVKKV
jgi:serine/threonine protein phosphatase PrpC